MVMRANNERWMKASLEIARCMFQLELFSQPCAVVIEGLQLRPRNMCQRRKTLLYLHIILRRLQRLLPSVSGEKILYTLKAREAPVKEMRTLIGSFARL